MVKSKRLLSLSAAIALMFGIAIQAFLPGTALASSQQITARSLTLAVGSSPSHLNGSPTIPDGGSMPGATTDHNFDFTVNSLSAIGSITFQYCLTGEPVTGGIGCYGPPGLNLATAVAGDLTGSDVTGWSIVASSAKTDVDAGDTGYTLDNEVTIGLASAHSAPSNPLAIKVALNNVTNPTTTNQTFYVRISAFSSTDGTGTATDTGTVAASTANPIYLSGTMPETLLFCTGQTITETNNVPDCSSATVDNIAFNQLFSPTATAYATSQMAASTNAGSGYAITVNGPTLTSGGNTINAINTTNGFASTGSLVVPGTSQFGMNVAQDTAANSATPAVSPASAAVTTPTGNSYYHGEAVAPYATGGDSTAALYYFNSGDIVANSTSQASDPQVYTATYMANVPGHQPAGTYSTTLTYICTATY